jgi:flavin reductase (DIM6/NTAB) family NADH-FMN oxidoreductase RutF
MEKPESAVNPPLVDAFRRAYSYFPSGTAIIGGVDPEDGPFGFTISTFSAVSLEPALVSFSLETGSRRLERLRRSARISISILRQDHADLARRFGRSGAGRVCDLVETSQSVPPIIEDAAAHLWCEATDFIKAGDHHIVIAAVRGVRVHGGAPLICWRRAFFGLRLEYPFLADEEALQTFIHDWQMGVLSSAAWTHSAHIAATAYHAVECNPEELFAVMKRGIINFNNCVGTVNGPDSGYHEPLTRFWSQVIAHFARKGRFNSRLEAAREAVRVFGEDRDLYTMYYSFDVARDQHARREWVPPDRQPYEWCMPEPALNPSQW